MPWLALKTETHRGTSEKASLRRQFSDLSHAHGSRHGPLTRWVRAESPGFGDYGPTARACHLLEDGGKTLPPPASGRLSGHLSGLLGPSTGLGIRNPQPGVARTLCVCLCVQMLKLWLWARKGASLGNYSRMCQQALPKNTPLGEKNHREREKQLQPKQAGPPAPSGHKRVQTLDAELGELVLLSTHPAPQSRVHSKQLPLPVSAQDRRGPAELPGGNV